MHVPGTHFMSDPCSIRFETSIGSCETLLITRIDPPKRYVELHLEFGLYAQSECFKRPQVADILGGFHGKLPLISSILEQNSP